MRNIAFSYGKKPILQGFNLEIQQGKTYCLVGSSGSGKTTTLRLINGLLRPQSGDVLINGKPFDFSQAEKWRRNMGYAIQGSGLFPHMTVKENLSIIARKEGWSKQNIQKRCEELCDMVNLPTTKDFLDKKPRQISGGQKQRVGIARALFMKPDIMLMDEPFSALDPITRNEIQNEFVELVAKLKMTVVLVTHDLPEAFRMANEIVLLNQGKIEQKGRPSQFLLKPKTEFVADFIRFHSPGNILKEIFLYSVVNTDLYSCHQDGQVTRLKNLETGKQQSFPSQIEAQNFLEENKQSAFYWCDEFGKFLNYQLFDNEVHHHQLQSTDHILNGMTAILDHQVSSLPVVNKNDELIGVFSREALDAL